ncbi:MAG: alpha/beta hydrolase [Acidimicrobiia bacterium]|nr:alpha/beta hydrolase [Acidimicrobiia bacterium]
MSSLLLLHGYPMAGSAFSQVRTALDPAIDVHTPDLLGFGDEGWPADGDLSMEAQADHVQAYLDTRGITAAVVVGFSMGGYVALALAERAPERVAALGLVGSKSDPDTPEGRDARDQQAETVVTRGAVAIVDPLTEALTAPGSDLIVRARLRTLIESTSVETYVSALAGMRDRPDRTAVIADYRGPFAIQVGTLDPVVSVDRASELAATARNGRLEVLDGIGHMIPFEAPHAMATFCAELVERASRTDS